MVKPAAVKKPRKANKKVQEEYGSYIVEVADWETSYSFTVNRDDRFFAGSYGEHLHLELKGILRYPFKFDGKDIRVLLLGDRKLTAIMVGEKYLDPQLQAIGGLTIRGEYRHFSAFIPFDTIPVISSLLQAKQVRFISLSGKALFRGSAPINWINFMRDFDPEEW
jgi:hypothetical protein